MIIAQVEYLLTKLGYPKNQWTSLYGVTSISLMQDLNLLVEPETKRFKFNTTTSTLEVAHGKLVSNVFIPDRGTVSVIEPNSFVAFSAIHGFITSSYISSYGSLYNKYFLTKAKI